MLHFWLVLYLFENIALSMHFYGTFICRKQFVLEYLLKQHLCIKLNHLLLLKCVQLVVKDPHKYVQEYTILGQATLLTSTLGTKLEKSDGVGDG